jgi:hypothetical protein
MAQVAPSRAGRVKGEEPGESRASSAGAPEHGGTSLPKRAMLDVRVKPVH